MVHMAAFQELSDSKRSFYLKSLDVKTTILKTLLLEAALLMLNCWFRNVIWNSWLTRHILMWLSVDSEHLKPWQPSHERLSDFVSRCHFVLIRSLPKILALVDVSGRIFALDVLILYHHCKAHKSLKVGKVRYF